MFVSTPLDGGVMTINQLIILETLPLHVESSNKQILMFS